MALQAGQFLPSLPVAGDRLVTVLLSPLPASTRLAGLVLALALLVVSPTSTGFAAQPAAGATRSWTWPSDPPHRVVRPFIAPATPYAAGHRGIDLAAPVGATVYSPEEGIIHFAGMVAGRSVLSIEHSGGLISSFEPVTSSLGDGTAVRRGQAVGEVAAASGHCAASCLHFGVRLHGQYVSPLNYLGGVPRSVLLPTRSLG